MNLLRHQAPNFPKNSPLLLVFIACLATPASAQQIESPPPPPDAPKAQPFLPIGTIDFHSLLPPPPTPDSLRDADDIAETQFLQTVPLDRRATAEQDSDFVYARFSPALGVQLDRATLPLTVALLNRSLRDVSDPVFAAKDYFHRPRPYQRLQLQHVCDAATLPKPEDHPTTGTSYPSGHSAYGWTVALVLAQVAPERAPLLLQRAQDYAESRVVCGVHFESDVVAGRIVAVATVTRLESDPGFEAALAAAHAEVKAALISKPLKLPD